VFKEIKERTNRTFKITPTLKLNPRATNPVMISTPNNPETIILNKGPLSEWRFLNKPHLHIQQHPKIIQDKNTHRAIIKMKT
jgi:hypothetical protein